MRVLYSGKWLGGLGVVERLGFVEIGKPTEGIGVERLGRRIHEFPAVASSRPKGVAASGDLPAGGVAERVASHQRDLGTRPSAGADQAKFRRMVVPRRHNGLSERADTRVAEDYSLGGAVFSLVWW